MSSQEPAAFAQNDRSSTGTFPAFETLTGKYSSKEAALRSPGLPLGGVCLLPVRAAILGRSSDLQAAYWLQLPGSWLNQCLLSERSFLFTAAGQFRILTGFPFKPDLAIRHRELVQV
jgi:hypothetical protein